MNAISPVSHSTPALSSQENLLDLFYRVMSGRVNELDDIVRSKGAQVEASNERMKKIRDIELQVMANKMLDAESGPFSGPVTFGDGDQLMDLGNGYGVVIEQGSGTNRSWKIVEFNKDSEGQIVFDKENPQFASETRIWGDPHVDENDGRWDFKDQSTFMLPDGTKITVGTVAWGSAEAVSSELFISRGNEQIHVQGLENNTSNTATAADDSIAVVNNGSLFHDHEINDGAVFLLDTSQNGARQDWIEMNGNDLVAGDKVNYSAIEAEYLTVPLTDQMVNVLTEAGFNYESYVKGGVLVLDKAGIDIMGKALEGLKDSLTSTSQLEMTELQSSMGKYNQSFEMLSNFIKKYFSSLDSIIRNQGA